VPREKQAGIELDMKFSEKNLEFGIYKQSWMRNDCNAFCHVKAMYRTMKQRRLLEFKFKGKRPMR
jgi:hypothetical protein